MKKYISLMNPYAFKKIWESDYRGYLDEMLLSITGEDNLRLLNFFSENKNNLRSYIILEGLNKIIFIDFNKKENYIKYNIDLDLVNYLKQTQSKEIIFIMFNALQGTNTYNNNIYQIYINDSNDSFVKFIFSKNFKEQKSFAYDNIMNLLYNADDRFYLNYLNEEKLEENIYNYADM